MSYFGNSHFSHYLIYIRRCILKLSNKVEQRIYWITKHTITSMWDKFKRLPVLIKSMSNIQMAKKEKKNFFSTFVCWNFVQITVVQKYYKFFVSKHRLHSSKTFWLLYICLKALNSLWVWCALSFAFLLKYTQ